MAVITKFKLPDVGEGLTEAELLEWSVAVGETVEINQALCEIETAKSAVELPSPVAGVIEALHVEEGETVEVGTVLVSIRQGGASPGTPQNPPATTAPETSETLAVTAEPAATVDASAQPLPSLSQQSADRPLADTPGSPEPTATVPAPSAAPKEPAAADDGEPKVKILVGTGPSKLAARRRRLPPRSELPAASVPLRQGADLTLSDTTAGETRVPIKGVRKAVAAAMTASAFTAPHATEWLAVDVTETMNLIRLLKSDPRWEGVRVNPMLFVAKALLLAIEKYPTVNAHWDEPNQQIVYRDYVNLGIAAATPRGLIVPNIKNAQVLGLASLANAVNDLVTTARAGRTTPAEMALGTITITNIGALGVDAGTPILNPGEAAILAFGAIRPTPCAIDGEVVIRQVAQLALSFDHRLVDGELGAQVLCETASTLTRPVQALLHSLK